MRDIHIKAAMAEPWQRSVALGIWEELPDNKQAIATNVEFEMADPGRMYGPGLTISLTAAQELMDSLWQSGIRPSDGKGSSAEVNAVKYHLEDMRRLVFKVGDKPHQER